MMRLVALIGLFVFGCAETQSPRCKEVCEREAECIEQIPNEDERPAFDRGECTSDCTNLSRDREGMQLIEPHLSCADKASTCDQLLACE